MAGDHRSWAGSTCDLCSDLLIEQVACNFTATSCPVGVLLEFPKITDFFDVSFLNLNHFWAKLVASVQDVVNLALKREGKTAKIVIFTK